MKKKICKNCEFFREASFGNKHYCTAKGCNAKKSYSCDLFILK